MLQLCLAYIRWMGVHMTELVNVSISTPSRHPANQSSDAYDSSLHHYRADYVDPEFWVLNLTAIPSGPPFGFGVFQVIPANIVSFTWTVTKVGTSRTAVALQSGLVSTFFDPQDPRSARPWGPDRPLVAPKVAGSSPVD